MVITYTVYILAAAWQDIKKKSISSWLFIVFGVLGVIENLLFKQQEWGQILASMLPGMLLLLLTKCSGGAIGSGDGCFFLVSALYLKVGHLIMLLCFGLMLCTMCCMGIIMSSFFTGISVRKKSLPFLPFLLPVWIWLCFL